MRATNGSKDFCERGTRLSDIDRRERRDEEEEDRWWSWWWLDQELRWREARRRECGEDL
jgi:hypothetical protein